MSMSLSQGQYFDQRQAPALELRCALYRTVGDIELLSLHRIRTRIKSLNVHDLTRKKLVGEILRENADYRKQFKNNWYCLTPTGLDNAIAQTLEFLDQTSISSLNHLSEGLMKTMLTKEMQKCLKTQELKMKGWFADNYDELIYDTTTKIPFAVVQKLRGYFQAWAFKQTNPFSESILDFVETVAKEEGLNTEKFTDYQDVWAELQKRDIRRN
jgi:hypothetical protein